MSEFKGTKGDWKLTDKKRGIEVKVKPNIYKSICTSTGNTKWQYDMLLISKAPEMLEMLIELRNFGATHGMTYDLYEGLDKLIKQATEL